MTSFYGLIAAIIAATMIATIYNQDQVLGLILIWGPVIGGLIAAAATMNILMFALLNAAERREQRKGVARYR